LQRYLVFVHDQLFEESRDRFNVLPGGHLFGREVRRNGISYLAEEVLHS
jgi:hypothetical protein